MTMLCSRCSLKIKPIVVSDIDGVLAKYHESVTAFNALYHNTPAPFMPYTGDEPFRDYLGLTKEQHRAMKLAYRQGGNKRFVPMYPGADDLINDIRFLGAEIWVATTRPFQRLDNIDPDTVEWLQRNGIRVDGILSGEDKYEQLVNTVEKSRIVACFEDLPEQISMGLALELPMFHVYRDHNQATRFAPGGNLRQAFVYARNAIVEWENNDG